MKNYLLLITIVFLIISCKNSKNNKVEKNVTSLEELEVSIDALFNSKIGTNEPGAAVMIAHNQEMIIGKSYGLRDLETNKPITINTNIRMASLSKQFTALCILSLVDKGLLSVNNSVTKFWDYPVFEHITVEHLINHTSGIADYEAYFDDNWDRSKIVENKDILEWLATNPKPIFEPGKDWEYSNTTYLVLALLVEKVSGEEFSNYAKMNIFNKAGMTETNYYSRAHPIEIKERAFCYDKDSAENWEKVDGYYMNGVMGDGAVYTNIVDFLNYSNALDQQSIVSKEMHALIFEPSSMALKEKFYEYDFLDNTKERYGMGWFLKKDIALHTGSWIGTRTIVVKDLDRSLTIAIFLNFASSDTRTKLIEKTYKLVDEYIKNTTSKS